MISNLLVLVQGCWWPEPILAVQGTKWDPTLDTTRWLSGQEILALVLNLPITGCVNLSKLLNLSEPQCLHL